MVSFVDKYITCENNVNEMEDLVNSQMHRHAKTCKKMGHVCRFNFPLPPMSKTMVLTPLEDFDNLDQDKQKHIKQNSDKI